MQKSKGFTIIELLIVVAIIAILTGIVLVNVTAWVNQGKDSSIHANLTSIHTNSAKWLDETATYTGFCTDSTYTGPSQAIADIGGTIQNCNETDTTFCACSSLKSDTANVFCVDSTGVKKVVPATDCATECDAGGLCL